MGLYSQKMRIAVINLQSGIGITKGYREYFTSGWKYVLPHPTKYVKKAGELLKQEEVEIALMTELDENGLRAGFKSQSALIREVSGLTSHFFFPTRAAEPLVREGNGIFTSHPIQETRTHVLVSGIIPRVMGETILMVNNRPLHVFVAHLGIRNVHRIKQIERIRKIITERNEPVILGGDFNERDHEAFEILKTAGFSHLSTLPTYPSWKPKHPLSVLFLSKHFDTPRAYIPSGAPFSDHLPLVVETKLL